jgi:secreted trypsin-like serine protease
LIKRSEGFIVGGENAKQGAYPFMAALGVENKNNPGSIIYVCGGSLVS